MKAAVIGCGRMGAFTSSSVLRYAPTCWLPLSHAEAIASHPTLELMSLCDTDPIALRRAAERYKVKKIYSNPEDLLINERPNLIGLATRTPGRANLIQLAISAGTIAIHTEKPLCNSVAELGALNDIFSSDKVFLTWGAIRRFLGAYRQAFTLVQSGQYGKLREIRVHMGSAPLYWTHPHSIDLLLFAADGRKIEGVQARMKNVVTDEGLSSIDSDPFIVSASVYFEGGIAGHITQGIGSDVIFSCEDGEVSVRGDGSRLDIYKCRDSVYPDTEELQIDQNTSLTGTLGPISQLVKCIEGDPSAINENTKLKRDILNAQAISFAMLQSHFEAAKVVSLDSVDPNMLIRAKTNGKFA